METIIDHYMDDALDFPDSASIPEATGYVASRDVDEELVSSLTKDVAFRRRSFETQTELDTVPDTDGRVSIGTDDIEVELIQGIDEENFKKVTGHVVAYNSGKTVEEVNWEEILRGGLQTALESQVIVFAVHGVSRACTHQLVRTRKAAFHQQSQRANYYGPHPATRFPDSAWRNPRVRSAALRAIYFSHKAYEIACEENISYQDARYFLLEGTTNWIMLEYPLRTFIDTYAYRACSMFQWEIVTAFRKMKEVLVAAHPWMEPYVKISCEKTSGSIDQDKGMVGDPEEDAHACTYQGYEYVEDQCDFPWARESNRTFVPDPEHRIERK